MELFKVKEKSLFNRIIFRSLVISGFVCCLIIMNMIEPVFKKYSGGIGTLDMRLGYAAADVYELFGRLGSKGRSLYIGNLCIDFVFIASFVFVQNYILGRAMGKSLLKGKWRFLMLIADFRALFDTVENIIILILLFNYRVEFTGLITVASFVTVIKFVMLWLWMAVIPVSLIARWQTGAVMLTRKRERIE